MEQKGRQRIGLQCQDRHPLFIPHYSRTLMLLFDIVVVPGPRVGKYVVDVASLESFGVPLISPHTPSTKDSKSDTSPSSDEFPVDVYILDEIGRMECCSPLFIQTVRKLMQHTRAVVLASVPIPKSHTQCKHSHKQSIYIHIMDCNAAATLMNMTHIGFFFIFHILFVLCLYDICVICIYAYVIRAGGQLPLVSELLSSPRARLYTISRATREQVQHTLTQHIRVALSDIKKEEREEEDEEKKKDSVHHTESKQQHMTASASSPVSSQAPRGKQTLMDSFIKRPK